MKQSAPAAGALPAARLPTGTVTLLFTDIEGSTRRWELYRSAMAEALRRHDAILRTGIERHRGYVFKTIGDAFCAAFAVADDGVRAALEIQQTLARSDWRDVDGIAVRMALHTGVADERDGDYFGPTVNRVARFLSAASGGQILVSAVTASLAGDALAGITTLRDLGTHQFRGLAQPERVLQVDVPGLPSAFPPLRSIDARNNNLPAGSSPLIGRGEIIAAVCDALDRTRLVTLLGTGGIGKTRVALAVAERALERFGDGVWFVELAALSAPNLVAATVAGTLGLQETAGGTINAQLHEYVKGKRLLLVFDNCEHVVAEAAALAASILGSAPDACIITTTREALNLAGERIIHLPSLDVPAEGAQLDADGAMRHESIALFVERARSVDARFALTDDNASTVAEICRRLDGIALAIELAAVRTKILGLSALKARLSERFRLLTGGSRTALPRQQTMRALIDWSYDLLSADERRFLRTAAVFSGNWTVEAAEAVSAADIDVLACITSLVEKSLIVADIDTGRYRLLETTRAYAAEKLHEAGEAGAAGARHARWIAASVASWYDSYPLTPVQRWLPDVLADVDNIRAALTWALGEAGDPVLAARIAGGLEGLWYNSAHNGEGRGWVETVLARVDERAPADVMGALWLTLARLSFAKGMVDAARRAIALFEGTPAVLGRANGYHMLAIGLRRMGKLGEAEAAIDAALELYARANRAPTWPHITALDVRAGILRFAGRTAEARALRSDAMRRFEAIGDRHGAATVRLNLADLEAVDGNPQRAIALSEEAAAIFRESDDVAREATAVINVAAFRLLAGDVDAAHAAASAGLKLALRAGWHQGIAIAVQHIASVAAERADADRAALLLGYVDAWYASESFTREPTEQLCYERTLTALARHATPELQARLLRAGEALSESEAVREALRD